MNVISYFRQCSLFLIIISVFILSCKDSTSIKKEKYPLAEENNIDSKQLEAAFSEAGNIADLKSLVISRNSVIVAEEYFNGGSSEPDSAVDVRSVTKSISSTLIGIAIDKGYITDVNQTLSDFLEMEVDTVNEALGQVTIAQLLTMTCGQSWRGLIADDEFIDLVYAPDQLNYILEKPVVYPHGTLFNYSDGAAHLISVILTKATGLNAAEFALEHLFTPLNIGSRFWYVDNRGYNYGGAGLAIGAHDMIKIGNLYLNNGIYNQQQVVSSQWILKATSPKVSTNNALPNLPEYGYYWWIGDIHGHDFILANGYGGQFIFIAKDLNLVVTSTCNFRGIGQTAGENWMNILDIILHQILTAVNE